MIKAIEFKGITWDHERGYNPLIPVSEAFCKDHPGVSITWKRRTLKEFEDFPVSKLAEQYDFIMIDHPYMEEAYQTRLLVPLNPYIEGEYLRTLERESIGRSLESYCVHGEYLGLPVDAATQVAAADREGMEKLGESLPAAVNEVIALSDRLGRERIGLALAPTHIFSTFMTLTGQLSGENYFDLKAGVDPEKGVQAAALLAELVKAVHPDSFGMDPIQLLDRMAEEGEIVYTPYVYGYSNYSRAGFRTRTVTFYDAPLIRPDCRVSTQMGGVGISLTHHIPPAAFDTAVEFAKYLASPEVQRGVYTREDGQPACLSAWEDAENNRITGNFFLNTLETHKKAFLRPKATHWNQFQEEEGKRIHRRYLDGSKPEEIVEEFNRVYRETCSA